MEFPIVPIRFYELKGKKMNKKHNRVAKKHRKNRARLKALKLAAAASGKNPGVKVAPKAEPKVKASPKKTTAKKPATKKSTAKKPVSKKKTAKKSPAKKTVNKKSDA